MKIAVDEESNLISKLKDGDEEVIKGIYQNNEEAFIEWARYHFLVDHDQAKDIFQLSIIALYQNAKTGRLHTLTASIKTYIFSIGRRLLLQLKKKEVNRQTFNHDDLSHLNIPDEVCANLVDNGKLTKILDKIGEPCNTILQQFYYFGLTMKQLVPITGYKTEAVVRKKKHECMEKLKTFVAASNFTIEDFLEC